MVTRMRPTPGHPSLPSAAFANDVTVDLDHIERVLDIYRRDNLHQFLVSADKV